VSGIGRRMAFRPLSSVATRVGIRSVVRRAGDIKLPAELLEGLIVMTVSLRERRGGLAITQKSFRQGPVCLDP